MQKTHKNLLTVTLSAVAFLLVVAGVAYLKTESTGLATDALDRGGRRDAPSIATPDTTLATDALPTANYTTQPLPTDSVGQDTRPADEAGAEDGYWSGYYDGVAGTENAQHDLGSAYADTLQRAQYAENYTEGYARGFREGRHAAEAAAEQTAKQTTP